MSARVSECVKIVWVRERGGGEMCLVSDCINVYVTKGAVEG